MRFPLYPNAQAARWAPHRDAVPYRIILPGGPRGLAPGAAQGILSCTSPWVGQAISWGACQNRTLRPKMATSSQDLTFPEPRAQSGSGAHTSGNDSRF